MTDHPRLDAALKRLTAALDLCEASAERLRRAAVEKRDLTDTLAIMQDDRGRLAEELDATVARAHALEAATSEVAERLDRAGSHLRRLIAEGEMA